MVIALVASVLRAKALTDPALPTLVIKIPPVVKPMMAEEAEEMVVVTALLTPTRKPPMMKTEC